MIMVYSAVTILTNSIILILIVSIEASHSVIELLENAKTVTDNIRHEMANYGQLYEIMEQVKKLQGKSDFLAHSESDRLRYLSSYQMYCNSYLSGASIEMSEGRGFGLRATEDIPRNKLVHSISVNETINYLDVLQYFKNQSALAKVLGYSKHTYDYWKTEVWMTLFIMSEMHNQTSKFKIIIDVMPRRFIHPVFFTPEQMRFLEGSQVVSDSVERFNKIVEHYTAIYKVLIEGPIGILSTENFSFELFIWSFTMVFTRNLAWDGNPMIIPCFEMVNHEIPGSVDIDVEYKVNDGAREGIEHLWATKNIKSGEEITLSYKPATSPIRHFFNVWGILEPNGTMTVETKINPNAINWNHWTLGSRFGFKREVLEITVDLNEDDLVNRVEFQKLLLILTSQEMPVEMTAQNIWSNIWTYLANMIEAKLEKYKCSEEDCALLLSNSNLSDLSRLALKYAMSEVMFLLSAQQKSILLSSHGRALKVAEKRFYDKVRNERSEL